MCNRPEAFRTVTRKAKKSHKCCECRKDIKPGESYQYSSGIWDGEPDSYKQCLDCSALFTSATNSCDQFDVLPGFGDLKAWFQNGMSIDYQGEKFLTEESQRLNVDIDNLNRLLAIR